MVEALTEYEPTASGPTALFLDTSGLFAYFHPDAEEHETARAFLRSVGRGEIPYRPLFTNTYVVDELVTLLQSKGRHGWAADAYEMLTTSESITVLGESDAAFADAGERFLDYDDHEISFTDHFCAVQMANENVDHVFAYDGDYETLGLTAVPRSSE